MFQDAKRPFSIAPGTSGRLEQSCSSGSGHAGIRAQKGSGGRCPAAREGARRPAVRSSVPLLRRRPQPAKPER